MDWAISSTGIGSGAGASCFPATANSLLRFSTRLSFWRWDLRSLNSSFFALLIAEAERLGDSSSVRFEDSCSLRLEDSDSLRLADSTSVRLEDFFGVLFEFPLLECFVFA